MNVILFFQEGMSRGDEIHSNSPSTYIVLCLAVIFLIITFIFKTYDRFFPTEINYEKNLIESTSKLNIDYNLTNNFDANQLKLLIKIEVRQLKENFDSQLDLEKLNFLMSELDIDGLRKLYCFLKK